MSRGGESRVLTGSIRERERESEWLVSERNRTPSIIASRGDRWPLLSWGADVDEEKGNGAEGTFFLLLLSLLLDSDVGDEPFFRSFLLLLLLVSRLEEPSLFSSLFARFALLTDDDDLVRCAFFFVVGVVVLFFLAGDFMSWLFDLALRFFFSSLFSRDSSDFVGVAGDDEENEDEDIDDDDASPSCAEEKSSSVAAEVRRTS